MNFKTRLFLILFLPGMAGVASFLLIDLSGLVALVPVQPGSEVPTITPLLKIVSLIQPTVLLAAAVLIGIALAHKVGLSAPLAESLGAGGQSVAALRSQWVPGLLGGLVGMLCIVLTAAVFTPFFMAETLERIREFNKLVPIPTRLLYGGITEELLMRWGFMTLVVWLVWRVLRRGASKPATWCFVVGIIVSSLVFGFGHLPVAFLLLPESGIAVILFVIIANSAFGIVAGYLYWKYGLEAAMIAHMFGHVLMAIASYAGLYF